MRSGSSWLMSGLVMSALYAFSPTAHAQAPTAQTMYEVCRQPVVQQAGRLSRQVMYFSGVMRRVQINDAQYGDAFAAFLREKYGIPKNVGMTPECGAAASEAEARQVIDVTWRDTTGRYTNVDTGWTYTPASPAARPAAAQAPPSPSSETVTFDCSDAAGKVTVAVTFYFVEGSPTPSRASIVLDGQTIEMRKDSGNATGWAFGSATGVGFTRIGTSGMLTRGSRASRCEARSSPSASAAVAAPAPAAAKPAAAPAPAAPPATKPAATPAPVTATRGVYVICRAEDDVVKGRFYNPPVDGADGDYATWMAAFKAYLTGKYQYQRSVGCGRYPTREAAQTDFDAWIAAAKRSPTINGIASPVFVTDWKFK
jgi:hypothetical protein